MYGSMDAWKQLNYEIPHQVRNDKTVNFSMPLRLYSSMPQNCLRQFLIINYKLQIVNCLHYALAKIFLTFSIPTSILLSNNDFSISSSSNIGNIPISPSL